MAQMIPFELDSVRGPISGASSGSGPALIMIAGLGASRRIWGDLPEFLSRDFCVFTVDNRGIGGSRDGDPFTLEGAVRDVLHVIHEFDLRNVRLLGVSLGGLIALETAILDPSRLERIVAVSCAAHQSHHGRKNIRMLQDIFRYLPLKNAGRALMTLAFAPEFHEKFPTFIDEAITQYGPDEKDIPGALNQIDALLALQDLRAELGRVAIPTLVLAGDLDPIVAPADTKEVADAMPHAAMRFVPGAAHAVLAEGGRDVFNEVVSFLRGALVNVEAAV